MGRMLSEEERKTLEKLKEKAKFEKALVRNIERMHACIDSMLSQWDSIKARYKLEGFATKEKIKKVGKEWFLNESEYWAQKKKLTEEEFEVAWKFAWKRHEEKSERALKRLGLPPKGLK